MSFDIYSGTLIQLPEPDFGDQDTYDTRMVLNRNSYGLPFAVLNDVPEVGRILSLTFQFKDCSGTKKQDLETRFYERFQDLQVVYNDEILETIILDDSIDFVEDHRQVYTFTINLRVMSTSLILDLRNTETDDIRMTEDDQMRTVFA